jgi:hypothetical protein
MLIVLIVLFLSARRSRWDHVCKFLVDCQVVNIEEATGHGVPHEMLLRIHEDPYCDGDRRVHFQCVPASADMQNTPHIPYILTLRFVDLQTRDCWAWRLRCQTSLAPEHFRNEHTLHTKSYVHAVLRPQSFHTRWPHAQDHLWLPLCLP